MNLPDQPPTFRPPTPAERPWWWRLEDAAGAEVDVAGELADQRFASQADAESWVGEIWPTSPPRASTPWPSSSTTGASTARCRCTPDVGDAERMLAMPGTTPTSRPTWRPAGRRWCAPWCCSAARRPRPTTWRGPGSPAATATGSGYAEATTSTPTSTPRSSAAGTGTGAGSRSRPATRLAEEATDDELLLPASWTSWTAGRRRARGAGAAVRRRAGRGAGRRRARRTSASPPRRRITHGLGRRPRRRMAGDRRPRSFRRASESIEVPRRPVDERGRRGPRRPASPAARRGRRRRGGRGRARRPDLVASRDRRRGRRSPAAVTRAENPVRVAWYADGRLHLDHVVGRAVRRHHRPRRGQRRGRLRRPRAARSSSSRADGERALLGHKDPDVAVVASAERGLGGLGRARAATAAPTLVVYDVSTGEPCSPTAVRRRDRASADRDRPAPGLLRRRRRRPTPGRPGGEPPLHAATATGLLDVESRPGSSRSTATDRDGAVVLRRRLQPARHRARGSRRRQLVLSRARPGVADGRPVPAAALRRPLRRPAADRRRRGRARRRRDLRRQTTRSSTSSCGPRPGGPTSTATSTRCWCCAPATCGTPAAPTSRPVPTDDRTGARCWPS